MDATFKWLDGDLPLSERWAALKEFYESDPDCLDPDGSKRAHCQANVDAWRRDGK